MVSLSFTGMSVWGEIKGAYIALASLIFQASLAVIGIICDCCNLHVEYINHSSIEGKKTDGNDNDNNGNNVEAVKLADNFFDFVLNVDNAYLLVPAPYGRNIVFGWLYVSILMYLANKTSEDANGNSTSKWVDLCSDDEYGAQDQIETGSCLIRHACFSVLSSFGAYSVTLPVLLSICVFLRSLVLFADS